MKLRIVHRSEYRYAAPVTQNWNELKLKPGNNPRQHCAFFLLRVLPSVPLKHFPDLHGNTTHYFEITEPHQHLLFEAHSIVETRPDAEAPALLPDLDDTSAFLGDTQLVHSTPDIWRAAVDVQDPSGDIFLTAQNIMRHVHHHYRYEAGKTSVDTTAAQVFRERAGVCQDFAHIMLAMLRALHIPARYISGYFYDHSRGQDLRGAHASHAWCEAFLPVRGWLGFDPTNNQIIGERYAAVAHGRDYNDVAPVRGTFLGASKRTMNVSVSVEKIA